jgi:hypothetical protein
MLQVVHILVTGCLLARHCNPVLDRLLEPEHRPRAQGSGSQTAPPAPTSFCGVGGSGLGTTCGEAPEEA